MQPDDEIARLRDLMPASGRMLIKIVDSPQQTSLLTLLFPSPWRWNRRIININFEHWLTLSVPERDLLLLVATAQLLSIAWFKLDVYQAITLLSLIALMVESRQGDVIGMVAILNLWRIIDDCFASDLVEQSKFTTSINCR